VLARQHLLHKQILAVAPLRLRFAALQLLPRQHNAP